jgi:hypothetical protein
MVVKFFILSLTIELFWSVRIPTRWRMEDVGTSVDDQQVTKYDQDSQLSLDINRLAKSLRADMEMLHSFSDQCCIYRVPIRLRK